MRTFQTSLSCIVRGSWKVLEGHNRRFVEVEGLLWKRSLRLRRLLLSPLPLLLVFSPSGDDQPPDELGVQGAPVSPAYHAAASPRRWPGRCRSLVLQHRRLHHSSSRACCQKRRVWPQRTGAVQTGGLKPVGGWLELLDPSRDTMKPSADDKLGEESDFIFLTRVLYLRLSAIS